MSQQVRSELKQQQIALQSASTGTALALVAALCGGVISITVATAKSHLSIPDLIYYRFLLSTGLLAFLARKSLGQLLLKKSAILWLLGLSGSLSVSCYYWTLQNMNLGTAMMLANTSLLFTVVLSKVFLKESLPRKSILGVFVMFLAVCLVRFDDLNAPTLKQFSIGFLGAFALSSSTVCIRATAKKFSVALLIFVFSFCTTIVAATLPGFSWRLPDSGIAWVCILLTLLAGLGANVLYTLAMKHLHAGIVGALTKTAMVWALLFVFLQSGHIPSTLELAAYLLTLLAVLLLHSFRVQRKPYCYCHESFVVDWESEGFVETAQYELPKIVRRFEAITSCELKFHIDNVFDGDAKLKTRIVFEELRLEETELRNGILIVFFRKLECAAVFLDSGISTQIGSSKLKKWCKELLSINDVQSLTLTSTINRFAERMSDAFPVAIDDVNELSDEVSIVWE